MNFGNLGRRILHKTIEQKDFESVDKEFEIARENLQIAQVNFESSKKAFEATTRLNIFPRTITGKDLKITKKDLQAAKKELENAKKKFKDTEKAANPDVKSEKIVKDMIKLNPRFDLRKSELREHPEDFLKEFLDPTKNYTSKDIKVPEKFRDWLMAQDDALHKFELLLLEWEKQTQQRDIEDEEESLGKKSDLNEDEKREEKRKHEKPSMAVLFAGEMGTGKSLLIKIGGEILRERFNKLAIKFRDVVLAENRINKYRPLVRYITPAGAGKRVGEYSEVTETQRDRRKHLGIIAGLGSIMGIGFFMMALGLRAIVLNLLGGISIDQILPYVGQAYFMVGMSLVWGPVFIIYLLMQRQMMGLSRQH